MTSMKLKYYVLLKLCFGNFCFFFLSWKVVFGGEGEGSMTDLL